MRLTVEEKSTQTLGARVTEPNLDPILAALGSSETTLTYYERCPPLPTIGWFKVQLNAVDLPARVRPR